MVYDGKLMLLTGSDDGDIKFWHLNPSSGKFEYFAMMPNGHVRAVTSLVLNPKEDRADGKTLVISGSADHSVKIWEVPSLICLHTIQPTKFNVPVSIPSAAAKPGGFAGIAHASVGVHVASTSQNGDDVVALEIVQVEVPTVFQLLYIGCRSGEVRCYNITDVTTTKPILATDPKHYIAPGPVELTSMCHVESKNDQLLFTGYADGRIVCRELKVQGINFVCFTIASVDAGKNQKGHFPTSSISYIQQVEDEEKCLVVSGGSDGRICVWNILDPS
jgi:WD40 repeat protein